MIDKKISKFYDNLLFPSKTSYPQYELLVPSGLDSLKIGDFGCGESLFINAFKKYGYKPIFLDVSLNVLRSLDYGDKIQGSITQLPLKSSCMDYLYCIGVVHHLPARKKAIAELIRVLKKKGRLYLGVYAPYSPTWFLNTIYKRVPFKGFKKIIYNIAKILIFLKHRKTLKYGSIEHFKRLSDLLETPYVKFLPLKYYLNIFEEHKCKLISKKRISTMNIIIIEKD